ncbi:Uncharacterised protein [Vibrio cholerae]|nr:Uncharacterised protein [Vibrio cholerae]
MIRNDHVYPHSLWLDFAIFHRFFLCLRRVFAILVTLV